MVAVVVVAVVVVRVGVSRSRCRCRRSGSHSNSISTNRASCCNYRRLKGDHLHYRDTTTTTTKTNKVTRRPTPPPPIPTTKMTADRQREVFCRGQSQSGRDDSLDGGILKALGCGERKTLRGPLLSEAATESTDFRNRVVGLGF